MEDIRAHLCACDDRFQPRLSARVDIAAYAAKIRERALTFEAWGDQRLIALVAAYVDTPARTAYITNVSVLSGHERKGLATQVLGRTMDHLEREGVRSVTLEVAATSPTTFRLYEKFGFAVVENRGEICLMRATLPGRIANEPQGTAP